MTASAGRASGGGAGPHGAVAPGGAAGPGTGAGAGAPARLGGVRGPLAGLPTGVLAAVTLAAAFAVAQGTGVRALGGVVLVLGVAWCAWRSWAAAGAARVVAVVLLGAACFVASHVLAGALGAWPSVALAAVVLGAGAWLLVDRRR